MEHKGGDLMDFTVIVFVLFGILLLSLGFVCGMQYEYDRVMRRIAEVAEEVKPCCGNCKEFNGMYCMKEWNNADECYLVKDRDSREPEDEPCELWEYNPDSEE